MNLRNENDDKATTSGVGSHRMEVACSGINCGNTTDEPCPDSETQRKQTNELIVCEVCCSETITC